MIQPRILALAVFVVLMLGLVGLNASIDSSRNTFEDDPTIFVGP